MTRPKYKSRWRQKYRSEKESFADPPDPYENWERFFRIGLGAEWKLLQGMLLLYADAPNDLAVHYLRTAINMVDRGFADEKFTQPEAIGDLHGNRAEALRARAYASALLTRELDSDALRKVSQDLLEDCAQWRRWDSVTQANYLCAVRPLLIVGDLVRAKQLLKTRRSLRWHAHEVRLLKAILGATGRDTPICDESIRSQFFSLFDLYRAPDLPRELPVQGAIAAMELGAIYARHFQGQNPIDWKYVVELVSE